MLPQNKHQPAPDAFWGFFLVAKNGIMFNMDEEEFYDKVYQDEKEAIEKFWATHPYSEDFSDGMMAAMELEEQLFGYDSDELDGLDGFDDF